MTDFSEIQFDSCASLGTEITPFDEIALREILSNFGSKELTILEVGSWVGLGSTKVLAEYASTLVCVDSWEGGINVPGHQSVVEKIDPYIMFRHNTSNFPTKIIPIRGKSDDVLKFLPKNTFDLIFIDAEHIYEYVMRDITQSIPLLKKDGILCGHDCEGDFKKFQPDLQEIIRNTINQADCDEIVRMLDIKLPEFSTIHPKDYRNATPLVKYKHLHCGVLRAVSDIELPKLYFSDKRLNNEGFASIWVAKKRTITGRNNKFENLRKFLRSD